jgi:hypothetical protein
MTTKSSKKLSLSNNVYVAADVRQILEEHVTDIGYQRGKTMSASAFVRYLILTKGDEAKKELLKQDTRGD